LTNVEASAINQISHEVGESMDRSKIVAVVTGAIAVALSLAYLIVVQLLDMRGEMVPAPMGLILHGATALLVR
jgi:hypothetical protein